MWSKMFLEMIIETLQKKYVSKITLLKALNKTLFWSVYKIVNMFYIWIFIFSRKIFLYIGYSIFKELCLYSFFSIISLFVICKLENKSFTWNFVLEVIEWRMFLLIHADTHAYTWTFSEFRASYILGSKPDFPRCKYRPVSSVHVFGWRLSTVEEMGAIKRTVRRTLDNQCSRNFIPDWSRRGSTMTACPFGKLQERLAKRVPPEISHR